MRLKRSLNYVTLRYEKKTPICNSKWKSWSGVEIYTFVSSNESTTKTNPGTSKLPGTGTPPLRRGDRTRGKGGLYPRFISTTKKASLAPSLFKGIVMLCPSTINPILHEGGHIVPTHVDDLLCCSCRCSK